VRPSSAGRRARSAARRSAGTPGRLAAPAAGVASSWTK